MEHQQKKLDVVKDQRKQIHQHVLTRVKKQRRAWRKDHPYNFTAKPTKFNDNTQNLLKWVCQIPGPASTPWENGTYTLYMDFSHDYPIRYYSIIIDLQNVNLNQFFLILIFTHQERCEQDWRPNITIKQILLGIQKLIRDEPNLQSPAQYQPCHLYRSNREEYFKKVRQFALQNRKKT